MRCLFAQKFFEILENGKRVINIDETWLPSTDFRSRQWKKKGVINTLPDRPIGSRTNLIAAISSDGEVYAAICQANTDTDVMMMFMSRLALVLTSETSNWRNNTVFFMDGASYHKSSRIIFKHLGMNVMITAPDR